MTHVYFVRHALPEHKWEVDRTRPLTAEGKSDIVKVTETLSNVQLDYAISSPYIRERERGINNSLDMLNRRWENFEFHEEQGESLGVVQRRNIEALQDILRDHEGESIIIGTHATALSTILNYYDSSYHKDSFMRIINCMPYIIRLDFDGQSCVSKEELLVVDKNVTEYNKTYKSK